MRDSFVSQKKKGFNSMLYTVITVCRNVRDDLIKTAESVLAQTSSDFEYVIIDGASTDGTAEKAFEYKKLFSERGIPCTVISEKDTGIYNAMNKGIDNSTGDWHNFMNAGDIFYGSDVLEKVSPYCTDDCDVVYGNTVATELGMYKVYNASPDISLLRDHWCMGHQSTFTSSRLMKEYHYDEGFKICADYDFYLKALDNGARFKYADLFIGEINLMGVSIANYSASTKENFRVLLSHGCITEEDCDLRFKEIDAEAESRKKKAPMKKLLPRFILKLKRQRDGWVTKRP